jgi:hypothetical protein
MDLSSSKNVISVPTAEYWPFLDIVTEGKSCNRYGGNLVCECSKD